jgi:2',3'-cyclic-nucleotide 2'-phosphodiesterase (5'-nucleotidase family)
MNPLRLRLPAAALLGAVILAASAVNPANAAVQHPDKLVILSTTDVKGKTGPCGCHVPKGGLARRASFRDSVAGVYGQVSIVDNGNFVPESDARESEAWFVMDIMKTIGVDAVGTGTNDLRFGYAKLKANIARTELPMTSANLIDLTTKRPALQPYVIKTVGKIKVGYFSLMTDKADLGSARDSLRVDDPTAVAKKMVAELRKKGATVVVLLSQLGTVESEDLVPMVPGIDAVICGRNVPVLAQGRQIPTIDAQHGLAARNTIASYGGEQGHYISQTVLTLNAAGRVKSGLNESIQLGPEIADRPDILERVKTFDAGLAEKLKGQEGEKTGLDTVPSPTPNGH